MVKNRFFLFITLLVLVSVFSTFFFYKNNRSSYLIFSDAAKFASIGKNVYEGNGYLSDFSFFGPNIFKLMKDGHFSARGVPLAMPYSIAIAFLLFDVSDFSIILTSGIFYVGLVLAVFLLGKQMWGNFVGVLSAIAVAANLNFLDYATSGASEVLFTFLAVLSVYFLILKKKWTDILFFVSLGLLYITRPQGFVFITAFFFVWLVQKLSFKKATISLAGFLVGTYLFDKYILYPLSWKTNVYPIFTRGLQAFFQYAPGFAVSDALRGGTALNVTVLGLGKKVFYNLYNFYKFLPQIASPYMWALFGMSFIIWDKEKEKRTFKFITLLLVVGNFLLVALTIPFFRYLHPVIPFVYIVSVATLVRFVRGFTKKRFVILVSSFLIFIFVVGQTLGTIFLDSRFVAARTNENKPPVYVELSYILKANTKENDLVLTNLDTWGTWYGERRTVWFPLRPEMIEFEEFEEPPFDSVYLTSYKIDDENYYMGEEWRQIFNNPKEPDKWNDIVSEHYQFEDEFFVEPTETYENESARAILLVKERN